MPTPLPPSEALLLLNHARELLAERGMAVLATWALLNIVGSGYYLPRTDARTAAHHFHRMNVGWSFVNAVLGVVGMLRAHPGQVAGLTLAASLAAQADFERILLVNAGLDVAYLGLAAWLRARSAAPATRQPARLLGYGRAVALQGAFLLVFDVGLYLLYHRYAAALLALAA